MTDTECEWGRSEKYICMYNIWKPVLNSNVNKLPTSIIFVGFLYQSE